MRLIDSLPPRAWTDVFVPTAPPDVDWFDFYCEWLADYLFATEIPLHTRQLEYASRMSEIDPGSCVFEISDIMGISFTHVATLLRRIDGKQTRPASANAGGRFCIFRLVCFTCVKGIPNSDQ